MKKNDHIIYWSKLIEDYKSYVSIDDRIKINNKTYILLLILFKNFILKDLLKIDSKIL